MTRPRKSPRLRRALAGTARCSTRCERIAEPPPSPLVVWNYRGPFGVNPVVCASSIIMQTDHRRVGRAALLDIIALDRSLP